MHESGTAFWHWSPEWTVGAIHTIFGRGLCMAVQIPGQLNYRYLLPFLPVAGTADRVDVSPVTVKKVCKEQHGTGNQTEKRKSIPLALVPLVIVGTWLTHLFGGSAGREGVAVQIGAVISHEAGKKFRCPENDRIMLVAGMAAGLEDFFRPRWQQSFAQWR